MKIKAALLKRIRQKLAGFSIIEATIGMGIVGTTVATLFTGFTSGFFTMQMARENLRATQIMLERVETIRLYSWDQINEAGFIPQTFNASYDPQAAEGSQGLTYNGTMSIVEAPIGASYSADLKLVTVTLNWTTGHLNRTRQFSSYISRYGLQDYIY